MRYISFLTTALTISKIRSMLLNEERLNGELQTELLEINNLKGCIACGGDPDMDTGKEDSVQNDG